MFKELNIIGVFEINPEPKHDNRGYFMCTYDESLFEQHGIKHDWVQENESFNERRGTLRGLHLQMPPNAQAKLIRIISGSAFFAFFDLRRNSPTFGEHGSSTLSFDNKKMLFVPRGLALGMCTMEDKTILHYKMDNYYHPINSTAIIWNDPDLNINWPTSKPSIISEQDKNANSYKNFLRRFGALEY